MGDIADSHIDMILDFDFDIEYRNEFLEYQVKTVKVETEKARLIVFDDGQIKWVPKKHTKLIYGKVWIPRWLAQKIFS